MFWLGLSQYGSLSQVGFPSDCPQGSIQAQSTHKPVLLAPHFARVVRMLVLSRNLACVGFSYLFSSVLSGFREFGTDLPVSSGVCANFSLFKDPRSPSPTSFSLSFIFLPHFDLNFLS